MSESTPDDVVLTPQLQLAIRMLQGNHRQLRGWIEEAVRDNPALSWAPPEADEGVDAEILSGPKGALRFVLADDGVLSVDPAAEEGAERTAQWLVSAVARRRRAIERLLEAILPHQRAYLRGEAPAPEKLSVAVLAAELGFHRSTVERLLRGKTLRIRRSRGGAVAQVVDIDLETLAGA